MKARARIVDIARQAGVSTATVDRVLNQRGGVRPATVQRVLKVASRLDYLPAEEARAAAQPSPLRLHFLLPAGSNRVIHMFRDAIGYSQAQLAPYHVSCRCDTIEGFNPEVLAASLLRLRGQVDGVAFMALDHPQVHAAVQSLAEAGIPAVTLISDLPQSARVAYVGLDNVMVGRTAGYLLGRLSGAASGKFAMIAGSLSYSAHRDREAGFSQIMEELFPGKQPVGVREGLDDSEQNYQLTRALLRQYPDLIGIYSIGGAAEGVGRALKEAGRGHNVVFVGHGLTSDIRAMLIDGTMDATIMQDPQASIMQCVHTLASLRRHRDARDTAARLKPANSIIVFRENLPY